MADTELYYPTGICKKCQEQLNDAYNFLQHCFKSKKILHTYITKLKQASYNCSFDKPTNIKEAGEYIFTDVLNFSSENINGTESRSIKTEIEDEDAIALPEFVSSVGIKSEHSLFPTAEPILLDTYVKEEIFHSEHISVQDIQQSGK